MSSHLNELRTGSPGTRCQVALPLSTLSKRKDRIDATADAASSPPQSTAETHTSRALDLASALQFGPGKPVPAPPIPHLHVQQQLPGLSAVPSTDVEFLQIQQFLASRCRSRANTIL